MALALTSQTKIALVGGGKMGEAIMGGWIAAADGAASCLGPSNFTVVEPLAERQSYLAQTYGVTCVKDASLLEDADMVVLAVKPQMLPKVLPVVAAGSFASACLFMSIAAGWATRRLESFLPVGAHLVRIMPNIPLLVGAGASTICGGSHATEQEVELVHRLFASLGKAWVVEESRMDVTCALSGSGPAYAAALIEAMKAGAVDAGFPGELAEELALQTVYGTAKLMLDKQQSAAKTIEAVCSPGGTTLAALEAMEAGGFSDSTREGVAAAIRRSAELGSAE